jgi:hypothetical protein
MKKRLLKKTADKQELGNKNMPEYFLNQILVTAPDNLGGDSKVQELILRELRNETTGYIIEVWKLNNNSYAVFEGECPTSWVTQNDITVLGEFGTEPEALGFINSNSDIIQKSQVVENAFDDQGNGTQQNVASRIRDFQTRFAKGQEPDYKFLKKDFMKKYKIKSIDPKNKDSYLASYKAWIEYMLNYYPEWAQYPAYVWRGWGYIGGYPYGLYSENQSGNQTGTDVSSGAGADFGGGDSGS